MVTSTPAKIMAVSEMPGRRTASCSGGRWCSCRYTWSFSGPQPLGEENSKATDQEPHPGNVRSQHPGGMSGTTCFDPGESAPFTKATFLGHLFSAPKHQGGPQGLGCSCEHGRHPTLTRLTSECWEVTICRVLPDERISPFTPKNHLSSFLCTQVTPPEATRQAFNQQHHSWRGVRGSDLTLLHKEQIPLLRAPNHPGLSNRHWKLTVKFP